MAPRTRTDKSASKGVTSPRKDNKKTSVLSLVSDRRWARWSMRAMLAGLGAAFALSLVVYPVLDYLTQRSQLASKQREFEALADANEQLFTEVQRLKTPDGVRSAARSQLGYVMPGEQRIALTPMPALPTTLPDAWPYNLVSNMVRVRAEQVGHTTGALAPLAP